MNPELPWTFGRSAGDCARSAGLLAALGILAVWGVGRLLMRPESPLAASLTALGVSPVAIPVAGSLVVLALAVSGYRTALRTRPVFRLTEVGLEVTDGMGSYLFFWGAIAAAGEAPGGAMGIKVRDREAVVATHSGTDRQREWLRSLPPFGEWDFLYPRSDLGRPVAEILERMRQEQLRYKEPTVD